MGTPRRILVIEPHRDFREVLELALEHFGFAAETVDSLDAGVRALERRGYDLVLTDRGQRSLDGEGAAQRLERVRRLAAPAPVGLMCGLPVLDDTPPDGFAFFLLKPFRIEQLLAALAGAMPWPAPTVGEIATVRAYLSALEDGDWGGLAALCSEDVRYHLPGPDPRHCTTITGRAAFAAFAAETFRAFREPRFALHEVRTVGDGVLVDYAGTWDSDGARRELPGTLILRFRGDEIIEIGVRVDVTTLAAGAHPASAPSIA